MSIKMIQRLEAKPYYDKLRALNLTTLKARCIRGDLIETCKMLKDYERLDKDCFEMAHHRGPLRGYELKL